MVHVEVHHRHPVRAGAGHEGGPPVRGEGHVGHVGEVLVRLVEEELAKLKDAERDGAQIVATLSGLVMVTTPLVIVASAAFVALMLWNNVRERRQEIAVLRAIGVPIGM